MKLLIYGNRKQDENIYDISTPEKEAAAYLEVFHILDQDWEVYDYVELNGHQKDLYNAASKGDAQAAKTLLNQRKGYEYEQIRIEEAIDATQDI